MTSNNFQLKTRNNLRMNNSFSESVMTVVILRFVPRSETVTFQRVMKTSPNPSKRGEVNPNQGFKYSPIRITPDKKYGSEKSLQIELGTARLFPRYYPGIFTIEFMVGNKLGLRSLATYIYRI